MNRWILKIERQHRLRLSQEIVGSLSWLSSADGSVSVTAHEGENGQVCVLPPKSRNQKRHDALEKHLSTLDDGDGFSAEVLALGRHVADTVSLTFSKERNRVTVVLPEEFRSLKCAPRMGEMAVVFVFHNVMEIWRADDWCEHLRSIRARLDKLIEDASIELGMEKE